MKKLILIGLLYNVGYGQVSFSDVVGAFSAPGFSDDGYYAYSKTSDPQELFIKNVRTQLQNSKIKPIKVSDLADGSVWNCKYAYSDDDNKFVYHFDQTELHVTEEIILHKYPFNNLVDAPNTILHGILSYNNFVMPDHNTLIIENISPTTPESIQNGIKKLGEEKANFILKNYYSLTTPNALAPKYTRCERTPKQLDKVYRKVITEVFPFIPQIALRSIYKKSCRSGKLYKSTIQEFKQQCHKFGYQGDLGNIKTNVTFDYSWGDVHYSEVIRKCEISATCNP